MLTLKGIYGREMYETWYQMTRDAGVGPRHLPRDHAPLLATATSRRRSPPRAPGESGKVILDWTDGRMTMFGALRDDLTAASTRSATAGLLEAGARDDDAAGRAHRGRGRGEVLNFCANNYLGLANHPEIVAAAHEALDRWGYGMASVRFICGTQEVHKELEARLSAFLGTEDTILYGSCFDANGGFFEALLDERDAVISDAAQPRVDHRRHPAVQGPAAPLSRTATWPTWRRG